MPTANESRLADHLLECSDRARPISDGLREPGLAMDAAERIQRAIRERRTSRGEQPVGYKIGFTNRRIWPIYGVSSPIWGPVYAGGVERLETPRARLHAGRYPEPRLEPEIVLGLAQVPADDDPATIAEAIGWVAHGVEVVHSVYPGWRFSAAESMASQAMHGSLHIGPAVAPGDAATLAARLAALTLVLERRDDEKDGWTEVATGVGADVLDGPVEALGHLVRCLRERGQRLAAGDIITTGTLVDAQPMIAGQRWRTRLQGLAGIDGLAIDII
jgi:2-oxo-3-hexenedioate decarboxylase